MATAPALRKARILVVEDEAIVAEDIASSLERLGYGVTGIAASGEDAIRLAVETVPDLILMDIVLQGEIDGIAAAEAIRERLDVPVLYLTAYADAPTVERAKETVPYGYLLKPWQERYLSPALSIALHKHAVERKQREQARGNVLPFPGAPLSTGSAPPTGDAGLTNETVDLRRLFDSIPAPIVLTDGAGRVLRMNTAAGQLAARDPVACVGAPLASLGAAAPWPAVADLAEVARRQRGTATASATDTESGRTWALAARAEAIPGGESERVLIMAADVTPILATPDAGRAEGLPAIGRLLSRIEDEVRGPLEGASATVDAVARDLGGDTASVLALRRELGPLSRLAQELSALTTLCEAPRE